VRQVYGDGKALMDQLREVRRYRLFSLYNLFLSIAAIHLALNCMTITSLYALIINPRVPLKSLFFAGTVNPSALLKLESAWQPGPQQRLNNSACKLQLRTTDGIMNCIQVLLSSATCGATARWRSCWRMVGHHHHSRELTSSFSRQILLAT